MCRRSVLACVAGALPGAGRAGLPGGQETLTARPSARPARRARRRGRHRSSCPSWCPLPAPRGRSRWQSATATRRVGTNPDMPAHVRLRRQLHRLFHVTTATQSARCSPRRSTVQPATNASPPTGNQPPTAVFKSTPDRCARPSAARPRSASASTCARAPIPRGIGSTSFMTSTVTVKSTGEVSPAPIAGPTTSTPPARGAHATACTTSTRVAGPSTRSSARSTPSSSHRERRPGGSCARCDRPDRDAGGVTISLETGQETGTSPRTHGTPS